MRTSLLLTTVMTVIGGVSICRAGELGINVIVSGQVVPGVYGQVQIGNSSPPPLVYPQPVTIEAVANVAPPLPVYLHVPPEHAHDWRHHCREYHACGRPVYFVRSAEYEPGYQSRGHEHGHDHDHNGDDRGRHHDDHDHHGDD